MNETKLKPTGNCFEIHGKFMQDALFDKTKEGFTLVHAEVSGQQHLKGLRFGHAWLEKDGLVFDYTNSKIIENVPKELYYILGAVIEAPGKYARYTEREINKMVCKYEHWGPWELDCEL